ncbi:hypothetical protein BBJ28_00021512 [Nothophytophthora sp. Chile5]|nr:hypothetical protein BBJ28_00021512 [Nothophytophthora sp. Chile5]
MQRSPDSSPQAAGTGTKEVAPFLKSLRQMLEVESDAVLRWTPNGAAFEIHDMHEMMARVLPKYFKHCKYTSFQRQLNYFNFRKWTKSKAVVCTFSNDFFLRDRPDLAWRITRKKSLHLSPGASAHSAAARMDARVAQMPKYRSSPLASGASVASRPLSMAQLSRWKKPHNVLPAGGAGAMLSGGSSTVRMPFPSPTDTDMMLKEHDHRHLLHSARRFYGNGSGNMPVLGAFGSFDPANATGGEHSGEPLDWIDCLLPPVDRLEDEMYSYMYLPQVPVASYAMALAAASTSGGSLHPVPSRKCYEFVPSSM